MCVPARWCQGSQAQAEIPVDQIQVLVFLCSWLGMLECPWGAGRAVLGSSVSCLCNLTIHHARPMGSWAQVGGFGTLEFRGRSGVSLEGSSARERQWSVKNAVSCPYMKEMWCQICENQCGAMKITLHVVLEDLDSDSFGGTYSFHKLGPVTSPYWTSDFFCKVRDWLYNC